MLVFLHLIEPPFDIFDQAGSNFPHIGAARAAAVSIIRGIVAAEIRDGRPVNLNRRIDLTASDGRVLLAVTFDEVVKLGQN